MPSAVAPLEQQPSGLSREAEPWQSHDFAEVYRQHFAFVWRSLRRLGVAAEQLDDAAQEVFLVVHRRLDDFDGRVHIRSWLFGIAHMVCLMHHRSVRKRSHLRPLPEEIGSGASSPQDRAEARQAVRFLEDFLETLVDSQRAVFILAELEQMSAPEIGDALGMKVNTVYSRLRLAREAFRAALCRRDLRKT